MEICLQFVVTVFSVAILNRELTALAGRQRIRDLLLTAFVINTLQFYTAFLMALLFRRLAA